MTMNRDTLAGELGDQDALTVYDAGERPLLPLVIAEVNDDEPFTGTDLVGELARRRGWLVPAYHMPPDNEDKQIMRMLVKGNQTREMVEALTADFRDSIKFLRDKGKQSGPKPDVHTGHHY
jgi:glutamate decarboxylase